MDVAIPRGLNRYAVALILAATLSYQRRGSVGWPYRMAAPREINGDKHGDVGSTKNRRRLNSRFYRRRR
jgi:hypothetical protein